MGKLDNLKRERIAERIQDPHAWAYEIEQQIGARAAITGVLIVAVLGLGYWCWTLQDQVDDLQEMIAHKLSPEHVTYDELPDGFRIVE